MDATSPNTAASAAAYVSARAALGRTQPDFADRMTRFDDLSGTVLDANGKSTDDQRVQAYQSLQTMSVTGQLIGIEDDRRKVLDQATFDSDIGQRAQQLSSGFIQSVNAAAQAGGAAAGLKAAQASFDSLSAADQNLLFRATLGAADRTGAAPFADVQAWRDNTAAQLKMVNYMQDAGVVGANGMLDHAAAVRKSGDAQFAAALKLSLRRDNNSTGWTQSVLQLFGGDRAKDRVDLSPEARKLVSGAAPAAAAPASPAATPYRAGSLISTSA